MPTGRRSSTGGARGRRITAAAAGAASGRRGRPPGTRRPWRRCASTATATRCSTSCARPGPPATRAPPLASVSPRAARSFASPAPSRTVRASGRTDPTPRACWAKGSRGSGSSWARRRWRRWSRPPRRTARASPARRPICSTISWCCSRRSGCPWNGCSRSSIGGRERGSRDGVRTPPHAQRILPPRRRQPHSRSAGPRPGTRHGLAGDHRSRQPPRGLAVLRGGEVALYLRQGNYEAAKASARYFADLFGPDGFWLEVQSHGIPEEKLVTEGMFRLSAELGVPVVATNDAHYLRKDDAEAHDVLLAIGTGKDLDDPNRFRFFGRESYVKSEQEMCALFPDRPDVIAETARLAALCEFDFEKRYYLPQYPRPAEFASDTDLLVHLARDGARRRYGDPVPPEVEQRLQYELDVIARTGYAGYFLIVYDFIKAAKDRGIPVGPGRGSAAGSLVAYALAITSIDPLKFDLLFERFLNPERVTMPDIDLDFCFERRGEVIEYVRSRYGRESVGQIITFGTLKARAAFRDVARTLRLEVGDVDRLTKTIPSGPAYSLSLAEAAEKGPELRAAADQDERVRKVRERLGTPLDMDALDLEDPAVYRLLRSGRTAGVFQFESPLATDTLRNMQCDRFDDLVATNALLRPGPLDTGMHLVFINRKLGREQVRYPHPALEEI